MVWVDCLTSRVGLGFGFYGPFWIIWVIWYFGLIYRQRVHLVYKLITRTIFVTFWNLRGWSVKLPKSSQGPILTSDEFPRSCSSFFFDLKFPGDHSCQFCNFRDQTCKFLKLFTIGPYLPKFSNTRTIIVNFQSFNFPGTDFDNFAKFRD